MQKIGRNDPCPCGSGRKYKRCCYSREAVPTAAAPESYSTDPAWLKIRRTEGEMVSRILEYAVASYGRGVVKDGLEEFTCFGEYEVDQLHRETIFLPWLAFSWVPEFDPDKPLEALQKSLGLEFLEENAHALDPYQQAFIREACSQPYSFFVITTVSEGESLGVRDIFLQRTMTVKESAASKTLRRGDIVFSSVVALEGQAIMLGMAPVMLPAIHHNELLDIRDDYQKRLRMGGVDLSRPLLLEHDLEIRSIYFDFVESITNPQAPELRNTDGEPLKLAKLYFSLKCTPQQALDSLKSLSLPEFQDDILNDAVFDANGDLAEVAFGWQKRGNKTQKHWDNTVLGSLKIQGDLLTVEVNSEKREKKIKSEIEKRLKGRVAFQSAIYDSVDEMLAKVRSQAGSPAWEAEREKEKEFQSRPEIQELVRKQLEAHWEGWYNKRIPALGNKTPLQAARTESGRERLEALLLEYENRQERGPQDSPRVDVAGMRKRLGLS